MTKMEGLTMRDEIDLEGAAAALSEVVEQEGWSVDEDGLADFLEELPAEDAEELLSASDPGGLVDTLNDLDLDLLE